MKKMQQKKSFILLVFLCFMMLLLGTSMVSASEEVPVKPSKGYTQVLKKGKYYWKDEKGKIIRKAGWLDVGKKTYYLDKEGVCATGFKKIKKKLYYFSVKGVLSKRTGWYQGKKAKYYYYEDYSLAQGLVKIGSKKYLFNEKNGRLMKNQTAVKAGKYYYSSNASGVAKMLSTAQAKCSIAARNFINKHSSASQSKANRFRESFNYLNAYMRYSPGYYSVNDDYAKMGKKDWQYNMALETLESPVLRGNCHRFACCVAAIAKELGYQPYVIATTGDHSFVMIDGRYYDNMGALFGATSHSPYTIYKKVKM